VTVHVRGDDDVELLWTHRQLMRCIVDENLPRFDLRILRGDVVECVLQHSLGELHDVRFGGAVHTFAPLRDGNLEREPDDLFASMTRRDLETLRNTGRL